MSCTRSSTPSTRRSTSSRCWARSCGSSTTRSSRTRPTSSSSEDRGRRIVLRAASERYAHLSGRVSMARGRGHRRLGAAERAAGLHPREGAGRPAHQVLPRARGGEVPVARVGAADRQGPARDRRDRAARRGAARVQLAGRGVPAARRLARGLRDRERAPLRAHAALAARARAALAARRAHRARGVGRRPALGHRRAGASGCSAPSRCASTCSSRAATGCACAPPRPARPTAPTSSRCPS